METLFIGSEKMTVDEKGRVGIPARFMAVLRSISPEECDKVGVALDLDHAIKVMPLAEFSNFLARASKLNNLVEEERRLRRIWIAHASVCELDKQNRIKLSPTIIEECRIGRTVMVAGDLDSIKIYDEAVWQEQNQQDSAMMGPAAAKVAAKEESPKPVQFVINAGQAPAAGAAAQ